MAFFEPRRDRVARNAKDTGEAAKRGTLVIGSQNLCFALLVIAIDLRQLAQAAFATATLEPLFAVTGLAVPMNLVAAAVITNHMIQSDKYSLP